MADEYFVELNINNEYDVPFKMCAQIFSEKGLVTAAHIHEDIEMLYAIKGNFEAYLDGACHEFSEGDLLVINSREIHMVYALTGGDSCYVMCRFALENLQMVGQKKDMRKYMLPFVINMPHQQKVFRKEELEKYDIHRLMLEALDEQKNERFGFELAIKCNILKVLVAVLRIRGLWDSEKAALFSDRMGDITKGFEYIDKSYASNIKIENVADICSMRYSYFSRVFKSITKLSFSQYLLNVRLREAEYKLATTERSITDIAFECGFSSSSYFVSKFRHEKGITPKQYRKMMHDKVIKTPSQWIS
ncbi:MAG: AraC family transcriptional regulator [Clostridia bacterium]|nr:AraC family transcriptional regulator [Clostridia bacterium]